MVRDIKSQKVKSLLLYRADIIGDDNYRLFSVDDKDEKSVLSADIVSSFIKDGYALGDFIVQGMTLAGIRCYTKCFDKIMSKKCPCYSSESVWSRPWMMLDDFEEYFDKGCENKLRSGEWTEKEAIEYSAAKFAEKAMFSWKMSGKSEDFFKF